MDSMSASFYTRLREQLDRLDKQPSKLKLEKMVNAIILEDINAAEPYEASVPEKGTRSFLNLGNVRYGISGIASSK